jgi:hypothetical protein
MLTWLFDRWCSYVGAQDGQPQLDIESDVAVLDAAVGKWGRLMNDDMQMDSLDHMGWPGALWLTSRKEN